MALGPLTNSLAGFSDADIATIANAILQDTAAHPIVPGAFSRNNLLFLPQNRGVIKLLPTDWVGVDSTGWPSIISARAFTNGDWTHS